MGFPYQRGLRELLKPHGMYSIRRFVAIVMTALTTLFVGVYLIDPGAYDPDVIAVLSGSAGVCAASAAVKKYDDPSTGMDTPKKFNRLDPRSYNGTEQ